MRVKALSINQMKKTFYVTKLKARDLVKMAKIDVFDPKFQKGYQRELSKSKVRAFGRFVLGSLKISPNSVLLAVRLPDVLYYDSKTETLEIPDNITLWVVDGQHRIFGLKYAIEKNNEIEEYEVPVIILPVANEFEEALQFLIINKTQKGVRTDLAERILAEAKKRGQMRLLEIVRHEEKALPTVLKDLEWKPKAIEIADELNRDPKSPWYNKIKLPNEKNKEATISQKSFTDSLEPIFSNESIISDRDTKSIKKILNNYWNAIKEIYPEVFERPKEYVLQKTMGAFVFNSMLPRLIIKMRDEKGRFVLTKERFKEILSLIPEEYKTSDVWRSADIKNGIQGGDLARMGTSKKTFSIISNLLLTAITNNIESKGISNDIII